MSPVKQKVRQNLTCLVYLRLINSAFIQYVFLLADAKEVGLRQGSHLFVGCPESVKLAILILASFRLPSSRVKPYILQQSQ